MGLIDREVVQTTLVVASSSELSQNKASTAWMDIHGYSGCSHVRLLDLCRRSSASPRMRTWGTTSCILVGLALHLMATPVEGLSVRPAFQRAMVTGANGYLGSEIVRQLLLDVSVSLE